MRTYRDKKLLLAAKLLLSHLGRIGGQSRSPAKLTAAEKNLIKARVVRWNQDKCRVEVYEARPASRHRGRRTAVTRGSRRHARPSRKT